MVRFTHLLAVTSLMAPFMAVGEPIGAEPLTSDDACLKSDGEQCSAALLQGRMKKKTDSEQGNKTESLLQSVDDSSSANTPHKLMPCEGAVLTTPKMSSDLYDKVIRRVLRALESLNDLCTPERCPQADVSGCILRAAGHDLMDYNPDLGLGGADGCMDMKEDSNKGLNPCLIKGEFGVSVYSLYKQFCDKISLADFIVMAAEGAMVFTRRIYVKEFPNRRQISFKEKFRYGRTTATECDWSKNVLPNPEESCSDVKRVFLDNMGLTWTGAAALMGVHTLGRAQIQNSGYDGWWSDVENSRRFNNNYFVSLVTKGWMPQTRVDNNSAKNQWVNSNLNFDNEVHPEMMLNTDLCLLYSNGRTEHEEIRAADHDCCAWTIPSAAPRAVRVYSQGEFCGEPENVTEFWSTLPTGTDDADRVEQWQAWQERTGERPNRIFADIRGACCRGDRRAPDCGSVTHPTGQAAKEVFEFADDEAVWLKEFKNAWWFVTNTRNQQLKLLDE